jgi:hypothetical protein
MMAQTGRATIDCAKAGFATRCAADATSAEPCAVTGTECNPLSFHEQCDGSMLKLCADGSIVSVECQNLGLLSCEMPSNSYTRCREGI